MYKKKGTVKAGFSLFDEKESLIYMLDSFKIQTPEQILSYIRNKFMKNIVPSYKDSKLLFEKYLYDITLQEDSRFMTILANLYLEICIQKIIEDRMRNPEMLEEVGHYYRLKMLNSMGIIEGDLYDDIVLVNSLRNKFAHNINFKICKDTFKKMSDLKEYEIPDPFTKKEEKGEYYHYILSLFLFQLIHRLVDKFEVLKLKRMD